MRLESFIVAALVGSAVLVPSAAAAAEPPSREELAGMPPAPGERALTGRLMAPCCAGQTLDAHASEPARALKSEIRGRLYAGESVEAVESSIVARYGEGIRATPARDPMRLVATALLAIAAAAGVWMAMVLRRWRRRPALLAGPEPALAGARDAYDERLDAELSELD